MSKRVTLTKAQVVARVEWFCDKTRKHSHNIIPLFEMFPEDTVWSCNIFDSEPTDMYFSMGWFQTTIGNIKFDFGLFHDGIYAHVWGNEDSLPFITNEFVYNDSVYKNGVKFTTCPDCGDPVAYDEKKAINIYADYIRKIAYSRPMTVKYVPANRMECFTEHDQFFVRRNKKGEAKFIDASTNVCFLRTTPVQEVIKTAKDWTIKTANSIYTLELA